jgi:alkaline phosphatase D
VSLADYRLRYASYRADPGLQELHRRFPIIAMWDDHETADNSWKDGAKNHGSQDGLVGRAQDGRRTGVSRMAADGFDDYDQYQIGDLATMFRLETRLIARSRSSSRSAPRCSAPTRNRRRSPSATVRWPTLRAR